MDTELRPGQPIIYRNIDAYPSVSRLRATVVQIADAWTTGVVPVQIRVRGSLRRPRRRSIGATGTWPT